MDTGRYAWKVLLIGLLVGSGTSAQAAVISHSHNFSTFQSSAILWYTPGSPVDPNYPQHYTEVVPAISEQRQEHRLTFDQFDSSLGTLTSVSISYNAGNFANWIDLQETCDVQNEPGCLVQPELTAYHSLDAEISAGSSAASASVTSPTYIHGPTTPSASQVHGMTYLNPVSHAGTFDFVDPADLANFTGTGTIDFVQSVNFWMQLTCESDSEFCLAVYRVDFWEGSAEVTYTYEPGSTVSSVTETPALALLFAGLFGLRLVRARSLIPSRLRSLHPPQGAVY